jgi:glycosyltransferase involved in cell wall biosynthesis
MHIAHVIEATVGGIGTYVTALIDDNLKRGYKVSVFASESKVAPGEFRPEVNAYFYRATRNPLKIIPTIARFQRALDIAHPDIVHLHSSFPGVYGRFGRSKSYKVVYCPHGWAFGQEKPWLELFGYALIERWLQRNTDVTINISNCDLKTARRWGITKRQVVVRNAVRGAALTGGKVISPSPDMINLGFVGRFDHQKGLDLLLDAMDKCAKPVHLWVAGKPYRHALPEQKKRPNVTFMGWLKPDQIDDFMFDIDALVIPSRWEGFGLVGIEAMRNGTPIIASDRGALQETFIHGYNGLLFNLDDPRDLLRTIEGLEIAKLSEMGANALAVFNKAFNISTMFDQIDELYHDPNYNRV